MNTAVACPSVELLRRSLDPDDPMPDSQRHSIEAHVDSCPRGCKVVIAALVRGHTIPKTGDTSPGQATLHCETVPPSEAVPQLPGYELLRELGRGGMGVVYEARQRALNRKAALKVLLGGAHAGAEELLRFQVEVEAVAELQHPNIVQVYEVGRHESLPYFALEYLEGGSLAQKLKAGPLPSAEAARLTETLARAVQHAHEHGILHRDLKPANILLSADGTPKVADFGLARRLEGGRGLTHTGVIMGTPSYMAPEQAQGATRQLTTAVDVYALGAILYELLTGRPPFEAATPMETVLLVRAEEPVSPRKLQPQVPRDLETICLKCLAKEPARRYESARALAEDLRRFRDDEVVEACPPSVGYRARKYIRRHRLALTAASLVAAALVAGSAVSLWQMVVARQAERRAEHEAQTAKTEAAIATAINEFLNKDLLAQASPASTPDRDLKVLTVLQRASQRIEGRFPDQPRVEAALRQTLGTALHGLGDYRTAERHHRRAAELLEQTVGAKDRLTLIAKRQRAMDLCMQGRLAEARKLQEAVLEAQRRILGAEDPATLDSLDALGLVLWMQGQLKEARRLYEQALEGLQRIHGLEHVDTLKTMSNYAGVLSELGLYAEAAKLQETILHNERRLLPAEDPSVLLSMDNLAISLKQLGRLDEAQKLHEEALALRRRVLTPDHPQTLASMRNLAVVYRLQALDPVRAGHVQDPARMEQARQLLEETVKRCRRILGTDNRETLLSMANLAAVLGEQGRHGEARKILHECIAIRERTLGRDHPSTVNSLTNLAIQLMNDGELPEALKLYEEALVRTRRRLGPNHPTTLRAMKGLAWTLVVSADPKMREPARGIALAKEVIEQEPKDGNNWNTLGVAYYRAGDWNEAQGALEKSMELRAGGDSFDYFFLAMTQWQLGHKEQARKWYDQAVAWMEKNRPRDLEFIQFRGEAAKLLGIR